MKGAKDREASERSVDQKGEGKVYAVFARELQERIRDGKPQLYCLVRRGWYLSTPEEKVRQHALYHLLHEKGYPAGLIGVERKLDSTPQRQKQQRIDILVYNRRSKPYMLIECKRHETALQGLHKENIAQHFEQLLAYQRALHAAYLALYNGLSCWLLDTKTQTLHTSFPPYMP